MCHAKNLKIQGRVWVFGQIDTTRNCYTPTYESTYHCTFGWKALHHGGETGKLVSWRMRGQVASFPETLLHQDNPWIILTVGINWFVDWGKAPKPCLSAPSCKFSHPSTNHRVGSSKVYRVYPETWGRVNSALKYTNRRNQLVWLNWLTKLKYVVSYILFCCTVDKLRSQQLWNEVLVLTRWCSPCSARPSREARFAQTATRRRNSSTIKRPVRTPEVKLAGNAQTAANHLHGRSPFFCRHWLRYRVSKF